MKENKCYTMEAKKFENKLNELKINYNDFKILVKMHNDLTLSAKAEVYDCLGKR